MNHHLVIEDLTVSYNRIPAVHHLNVTLGCGSAVGLIGPNGAGKTTLLKAIAGLMPEVALHEPASALDGGRDGLDAYRAILARLPGLLAPDGLAVLELGEGQEGAVSALAMAQGLVIRGLRADLGGVCRALILNLPQKAVGGIDSSV